MSMYAEYLREKTSDHIMETDVGFATYRYLPETKAVYIIDLYIQPDFRKTNMASSIADKIAEEAKGKGYHVMMGSVVPSNKNSTVSVRVLLAYGMYLVSSSNDFIIFRKDI